VIKVENVTKAYKIPIRSKHIVSLKQYEKKAAVTDLSFHIEKGGLCGFIGLNGAGKSTTIKMLCGILKQDEGSIEVNGIDPFSHRKLNNLNIGVVFGQRQQLWADLPVRDSFRLLKKMYQVSNSDYDERMNLLESYLDFVRLLDKPVRKLSLGERMKCEFAASLIHWPSVLYLDEPTIGIDIVNRREIRNLIRVLNEQYEKTIILTTHMLEDIDELCKQIVLIDHGQLVYDGTLIDFRKKIHYEKTISFYTSQPKRLSEQLASTGVHIHSTSDTSVKIFLEHGRLESAFGHIQELYAAKLIDDLEIKTLNVEDVLNELYLRSNS